MRFEKINIGLLIEQKMNELGVSKSEMARRSGIANQILIVFWSVQVLIRISL